MNKIKALLKKNDYLVSLYQSIIGYDPKAKQWCRIVMDESTENLIQQLEFKNFKVLEISGKKWKDFGFADYQSKYYPDFDICKVKLEEKYDLIIAEQVFEHLTKPYQAAKNIYNMLNQGGYFLITTPFLIKIHPSPEDCTRWSKTGIKYFLEECGFETAKIQSFSWGNKKCINANFKDWIPYNKSRHSLNDEENFPIVIWALAKK